MLSQTVEYALRAVAFLARQKPNVATTAQIALATDVSPTYLAKVIRPLVASEILKSRRGANGGITLLRAPEELTVLEIFETFCKFPRLENCQLEDGYSGHRWCRLHDGIGEALIALEAILQATTIAQLIDDGDGTLPPLCLVPGPPEDNGINSDSA